MLQEHIQQTRVPEILQQIHRPEIIIHDSKEELAFHAAKLLIAQVHTKPTSVITLPTGSTPIGMYQELARSYAEGHVDFSQITTFNLDEYVGLSSEHRESYAAFMQEHLFRHINVPQERQFIPDGIAEDPEAETLRYQELLAQYGPVDLAVVGIGPGETCHIAFNERGSTLDSRVRKVEIDEETRSANARFFEADEQVPQYAYTQGIADILSARKILLLANGEGKAWGIQRSLEGPIGPDAPASFLRLHPDVTVMIDQEAAIYLTNTN